MSTDSLQRSLLAIPTPPSRPWKINLILVAVLVGFSVAVVQSSFVEWAFHRFWLHRPWLPENCFTQHTLIHHQLCKFDDTFHVTDEEQHEALTFAWWGGPILIAISATPWALASWALYASGVSLPYVAFVIAIIAGVSVYYVGYESLHYFMHKPTIAWIERSRLFQFIKQHHRIHHVRMNRNLNVLLPLADLVLGTFVTKMPPHAPTSTGARRVARKHSRFGRKTSDSDLAG
ncbi:MAG: hypothetical protein E6K79_08875 [Candidatus Eisenbacteria bacterium]|uniref:Fatty acid hydroxylase n=1 Tax=Eiseniibacteriota bacterium TaxID=2212470 RepID=A0A538TJF3_UNCEI|nr:MAG: hypothetical protein E6K79_08875 [Candidatus Eisenbacteria bacterium]